MTEPAAIYRYCPRDFAPNAPSSAIPILEKTVELANRTSPVAPVCSLFGSPPGCVNPMPTSCVGFSYGSGERSTFRTIEYIAVVAFLSL